jgi:hypothetical protein
MSDTIDAIVDAVVADAAGKPRRPPPTHYMDDRYGPEIYAFGPSVQKWRRKGPIATMAKEDRRAYGAAVLAEVRTKQRQALQREVPTHNVICASGCNSNDGDEILKALKTRQRAALAAAASQERRARKPEEWEAKYKEAMKEKQERAAKAAAARPPTAKAAPIVKRMERKRSLAADMTRTSGAYTVIAMKQHDRFVVKFDRNTDGTKTMPEIIIRNQIKARYSHSHGGYVATSEKIAKLDLILASVTA